MPTFKIPTTEEIHQIAYVTIHGWKPTDDYWEKPGVLRTLNDEEERENRNWNSTYKVHHAERWTLESAYWHQRSISEPDL